MNFLACNFGWHKDGDLLPSQYLCVEYTQYQINLLNTTPRDVQLGATIDQCSGASAKKVIAKRRVDFVTGNVNSYAWVLISLAQLDKIKTYNQLSAYIVELQRERDKEKETSCVQKKKQDEEKKKSSKEKEHKDKDVHDRILPLCQEHVTKGLKHRLSLNVKNGSTTSETVKPNKMQLLKHVFNHPEAKTSLKKAWSDELLTALISSPEGVIHANALDASLNSNTDNTGTAVNGVVGDYADVMNFELLNIEV